MSKSEKIRELVHRYREKRDRELRAKARSFREFLRFEALIRARSILNSNGVHGTQEGDYYTFLGKVLRDAWLYVFKDGCENPKEVIDRILDYYEFLLIKRRGLEPKVVERLEAMIVDMLANIDQLENQFLGTRELSETKAGTETSK
jgi:hypothetical protein